MERNRIVCTDGGQLQPTLDKLIFLQHLKVTPQLCKAGSGSAFRKIKDPYYSEYLYWKGDILPEFFQAL